MKKPFIYSLIVAACSLMSMDALAQVTADFSISGNTNKCTNINYQFTNASLNATAYEWDFGDGSGIVTTSDPSHSYSYGGSFVVTLKAFDGSSNVSIKKIGVFVKNPPNAYFGLNTYDDVYPGDLIQFENYSNNGTSFSWDFGDASSSIEINPKHTYSTAGSKTVTLTVQNGCDAPAQYTTSIEVVDTNTAMPIAGGYSYGTTVCPNQELGFYTSSSRYKSLVWNFGDGVILESNNEEVYHTYTTPGEYEVTHYAIWDANRIDSLKITVKVSETEFDMPYSYVSPMNFVSGNYIVSNCLGSDFDLQGGVNDDKSTGYWRKHDGTVLADQYTSVSYNFYGVYDIWYVVENGCGAKDSTHYLLHVLNGDTFQTVTPSIMNYPNSVCPGETMNFSAGYYNESNVEYNWYINGNVFLNTFDFDYTFPATPGNYDVKLVRVPQCGRTDSVTINLAIDNQSQPDPQFYVNYSPNSANCYMDTVRFDIYNIDKNPLTHLWEFGDGNTSSDYSPTHVYGATGYFTALHHVTNACGVTTTYAASVYLKDNIKPLPRFSAHPLVACENEEILFDNFTMGADSAALVYGDGTMEVFTGEGFPHIFHAYTQAGTYTATLYVYNRCGGDSGTVTITVIPGPSAEIVGGDRLIETGSTLSFTKTSTGAVSHMWYRSFSEFDTTSADTLVMTFNAEGVYTIYLYTENEAGCYSIDSVHITVSNDPVSVQSVALQPGDLVMYPNPVSQDLNFWFNLHATSVLSVQIIDMSGRIVQRVPEMTLESGIQTVSTPMGQLPPGVYICNIMINGTPTQHKVVKY